MSVLENVTAGITLASGTMTSVITVFTTEPLVYFVGLAFLIFVVGMVRKLMMPRKSRGG